MGRDRAPRRATRTPGDVLNPERICTDCNIAGKKVPASFVLYEASGLAKFGCADHHERHIDVGFRAESLRGFYERLRAIDAAERLGAAGEPTEGEMLTVLTEAAVNGKSEAFLRGTVRRCLDCKRPVFGGPVRCVHCLKALELLEEP